MPPAGQTPSFWERCNQVTWYSKLGAIVLFLGVIPALSFYVGMQYQSVLELQKQEDAQVAANQMASYDLQKTTAATQQTNVPTPELVIPAISYAVPDGWQQQPTTDSSIELAQGSGKSIIAINVATSSVPMELPPGFFYAQQVKKDLQKDFDLKYAAQIGGAKVGNVSVGGYKAVEYVERYPDNNHFEANVWIRAGNPGYFITMSGMDKEYDSEFALLGRFLSSIQFH